MTASTGGSNSWQATVPRMVKRAQRIGVEDIWHLSRRKIGGAPCTDPKHGKAGTLVSSAKHGVGMRWKARFVDPAGHEVEKSFRVKADAEKWVKNQSASIVNHTYIAPNDAALTFDEWSTQWLRGYAVHRESTVRQAKTHVKVIAQEFGGLVLGDIKPSAVKMWTAKLQDDYKPSTIYAMYRRLSHVLDDAVHDGYLARNPCSRRTAPPMGKADQFCPTTEQVWQLHDEMPEHLRVAILLGAFAGLRVAETVALRIEDVDFLRGVVFPKVQWSLAGPTDLKTKGSSAPIPIPRELTLMLSASVQKFPGATLVTDGNGGSVGPWIVDRAVAVVRANMKVDGLRFHCLRHYLASLLIGDGCDVKTVQARLRHSSATTTLDTYAHMWPIKDETTRSAIVAAMGDRVASSSVPAGALRAETL
jgi:integrase